MSQQLRALTSLVVDDLGSVPIADTGWLTTTCSSDTIFSLCSHLHRYGALTDKHAQIHFLKMNSHVYEITHWFSFSHFCQSIFPTPVPEYPLARKTANRQSVCGNLQGRPSTDVQGTDRIFYITIPGAAERWFGRKGNVSGLGSRSH